MKKQQLIVAASLLALVATFLIGARVYEQHRAAQVGMLAEQNFDTFVRPHSQVLGSAEAKVSLVEFTDPACETCAAFSPFVKKLLATYPNKLKLVVRYAPFHHGSDAVVGLLHASSKQGKFWEALDIMYKTQAAWASHHQPRPELVWNFVAEAGFDMERLNKDLGDLEIQKVIQQDVADGRALGVTKTPGFFVNGKALVNFGYQELEQLVAAQIAASYPD